MKTKHSKLPWIIETHRPAERECALVNHCTAGGVQCDDCCGWFCASDLCDECIHGERGKRTENGKREKENGKK
jgi:hypothetical protein